MKNKSLKFTSRVIEARAQKQQSMGLWLSETIIYPKGAIEKYVRELAESGYGIIRTMLRNTTLTHRDAVVVDAVERMVNEAHKYGVLVALDIEPHAEPVGRDMMNLFPDAHGVRLVRGESAVVNGRFSIKVRVPENGKFTGEFVRVDDAHFSGPHGKTKKIAHLQYEKRIDFIPYDFAHRTRDVYYTEGVAFTGSQWVTLTGDLGSSASGNVVVYARFNDRKRVDFWSEGLRKYYEKVLECYRGIPLDGIGWDEPAVDGDWSHYISGDAFEKAFKRINGYDLLEKLHLLDAGGTSAEAVRVRLDYYRTLNEGVYVSQKNLIKRARELFGEDILTGTHHTWQGEGSINDYRTGAIDYYRLNENMDAGYTDCSWWDPVSVCYAYTLALSLGKLTPTGANEVNTWHARPTNSFTEYNARLMSLLNIGWFNIWFGEMTDTALYPSHYTWPTARRENARHREVQQFLGIAEPVAKVALLHGWETVTGVNRATIAGAHKTFCLNTSLLLVERNVAFDWIDTGLIAKGRVKKGLFETRTGRYEVLVLDYASILPAEAWKKVVEFAKAGGKVIFTGTPPSSDTEGKSIASEFAKLVGIDDLSLDEYLRGVHGLWPLPEGRPVKVDAYYPLKGPKKRLLISIENEPHGIRSEAGNVVYLTDLDPGIRLLDVIEKWVMPEVKAHSGSIQWRLYREGDRSVVVLIATKDRRLSGIVEYGKYEVEFTDGVVALLEEKDGELKVFGDDHLKFTDRSVS